MKNCKTVFKSVYWAITTVAVAFALTTATYAWFTSNHTVSTDTASARTGEESLTLQISAAGGTGFAPVEELNIPQVNSTEADNLMPVSTTDLQSFVYCPSTVEDQARSFRQVENESFFYHGRIYLRAQANGMEPNTRLALYLDQSTESGGNLASGSGELLTAARLGLIFDNEPDNTAIFRFTDEYSSSSSEGNTFLNGIQLEPGQVLYWDGIQAVSAEDPSVSVSQYTIETDGTQMSIPDQPLLYMNYNQIYQLDIYFYIEGCDPDCSETIYYNDAELHLAFYGIAAEEGK